MSIWLPGAEKSLQGNNGVYTGGPHKIVLHTTESRGKASFKPGTHSQLEIGMNVHNKLVRVWQYYPLDMPGRALVDANDSHSHRTNRDGAIQIEIDGTCDPANEHWGIWYVKHWPDWYYDGISDVLDKIANKFPDIDRNKFAIFDPYPRSIRSQRFSYAEWESWNGICGHEHVPENHHGDPGGIDTSKLKNRKTTPIKKAVKAAKKAVPSVTKELLEMKLTDKVTIPGTYLQNPTNEPMEVTVEVLLRRIAEWSYRAANGNVKKQPDKKA